MALDRVMGAMQLSGAPVILLANKQVRDRQLKKFVLQVHHPSKYNRSYVLLSKEQVYLVLVTSTMHVHYTLVK